jgi:hypothetical protein
MTKVHLQLRTTFGDRSRLSPGDGTHDDARLFKVADDQSVFDVEAFDLSSCIIVGNPPVGQNTVYVEKNGFDLGSFLNLFFIVSAQNDDMA